MHTLAMLLMLDGVKGGDRLGRPPKSGRLATTNLNTATQIFSSSTCEYTIKLLCSQTPRVGCHYKSQAVQIADAALQ